MPKHNDYDERGGAGGGGGREGGDPGQPPTPPRGGVTGRLEDIIDSKLARLAGQAVEELGVKEFIDKHDEQIYEKLLECDSYAESAKVNSDMMFIARSLPIINGIIHIASNRERLRRATRWVEKEWEDEKDPDAISILSALTLIYVAAQGEQKKGREPEQQVAWRRILRRVQKFSSGAS